MKERNNLLSLIFIPYALIIQPIITLWASNAIFNGQQNLLLSGILLSILILELPALRLGLNHLRSLARKNTWGTTPAIILWSLHALLNMMLGFVLMSSLGLDIQTFSSGIAIIFFGVLLKEFLLLFLIIAPSKTAPTHKHSQQTEFFLILFACISHTAFWSVWTNSFQPEQLSVGLILLASFMFLLFFLPGRLYFLLKDLQKKQLFTLASITSLLLNILAGISPFIYL